MFPPVSSISNSINSLGYVEVAVIPVGARNIQVMETKPCTSFLGNKILFDPLQDIIIQDVFLYFYLFKPTALKGSYDTYYVNGNWKIQLPGQVDVEGTKVFYDRQGTWERLIAKGPTKEPLHVMVSYLGCVAELEYALHLMYEILNKKIVCLTGIGNSLSKVV